MKFKLNESHLKESDSPVLDDLIDLGLNREQAIKVIKYFAPKSAIGAEENEPKREKQKYDIEGITLLSAEEAEKLPKDILKIGKQWWLRSPGYEINTMASVLSVGLIYFNGFDIDSSRVYARPALRISNLDSSNLKLGDPVKIFDSDWIVIDEDLVLLDGDLGKHPFADFDTYDEDYGYMNSEIKKYLEDWLEEQKKKFGY